MITNLLATIIVTLTTNTVTTDNRPEIYVNDQKPYSGGNVTTLEAYGHYEKYGEATEKTETAIVTETRTIAFDIEGQHREDLLSQREILRKSKTYKLDAKWNIVQDGPWTVPFTSGVLTNAIGYFVTTNISITNRMSLK